MTVPVPAGEVLCLDVLLQGQALDGLFLTGYGERIEKNVKLDHEFLTCHGKSAFRLAIGADTTKP